MPEHIVVVLMMCQKGGKAWVSRWFHKETGPIIAGKV